MSRVFRKTALGVATFTKQVTGLSASQRALLIMIDGKRSAGDLRRFAATFGDVNRLLRELYDAGMVELDPSYIEKFKEVQSEIAQEAVAMGVSFGVETTAVSSHAAPNIGTKRDLRDLRDFAASNPSSAPLNSDSPALDSLSLSLAPIDQSDADGGITVSSVSPGTFFDAKEFAKRYVFDALGNSGTALCLAIERTDALKGFLDTVAVARKTLRDMRGDSIALDFDRQLREVLLR
jgi:hypothetical protein